MIGKRITKRSINKKEFDRAATDYNNALKQSGYKETIEYIRQQEHQKKHKKIKR